MERIAEDLKDIIEIDSKPSSEKNLLTMVVSPKKEIDRIIEKLESVDTEPMENEEIIDE